MWLKVGQKFRISWITPERLALGNFNLVYNHRHKNMNLCTKFQVSTTYRLDGNFLHTKRTITITQHTFVSAWQEFIVRSKVHRTTSYWPNDSEEWGSAITRDCLVRFWWNLVHTFLELRHVDHWHLGSQKWAGPDWGGF
jgi:Phospholipase A1.